MSKFTKEEQTNIVKQAMELETAILNGQKKLRRLRREKFRDVPKKPVRKTASPVQPITPDYSGLPQIDYSFTAFLEDEIKTKPTFVNKLFSTHPFKRCAIICGILSILTFLVIPLSSSNTFFDLLALLFGGLANCSIPAAGVYWAIKRTPYKNRKQERFAQFMQSPEYLNAKAQADMIAQQRQAEMERNFQAQQAVFDEEYKKAQEHYDSVTLPQYERERSEWTSEHDRDIQDVSDKLDSDKKAQSDLYESSKIIPLHYRSIEPLTYIYQLMSTSDYNIKEAVDMYNKEIQRQQEAARIEELQRANALADEQNYRLMQQNELLNDQNELQYQQNAIAEKQRKDDRRREIETEYHRHQVRKQWKNK